MNKRLILIVLGLVCAAVVVGAGCAFLASKPTTPRQQAENAVDWAGAPEDDTGAAQPGNSIAIPGMDVVNFKANETKQTVNLYNPAQNSCFFQISMLLEDGTELYRSDLIAPGKGLYEIELLQTLPEGTYDGSILKYACFSMDTEHTPLNGAEFTFTIQSLP